VGQDTFSFTEWNSYSNFCQQISRVLRVGQEEKQNLVASKFSNSSHKYLASINFTFGVVSTPNYLYAHASVGCLSTQVLVVCPDIAPSKQDAKMER
jgi:hypothetical protein